jgi:hypothetical protein
MLSTMPLDIFRERYRIGRPVASLLPGRSPHASSTASAIWLPSSLEINKRVSLHTLRHSFATASRPYPVPAT